MKPRLNISPLLKSIVIVELPLVLLGLAFYTLGNDSATIRLYAGALLVSFMILCIRVVYLLIEETK